MRIICEGIDGSGKSFLTKQLSDDLDMPTFWSAGPPGTIQKVEKCCIEQFEMKNTVFDRVTCISEQCYNMQLSQIRQTLLNLYKLRMAEDSIFIYCTASVEESEDGLRNDEHDKLVRENFIEINERYMNIMLNTKHLRYNFLTDSYGDLLCLVKLLIQKTQQNVTS